MNTSTIISAYRHEPNPEYISHFEKYFCFDPKKIDSDSIIDENLDLRTQLTDILLPDFGLYDINLIRKLFKAELECERTIHRHDNLYQLSFYLYTLGQLEDSFLLYEAKYGTRHMDSTTMQDRESITVGHEVDEVIKYVSSRFESDPTLRTVYPNMLEELQSLKENPDYDSIADYSQFIRGYFYGHENVVNESSINFQRRKKPWWKFW